MTRMNLKLAEEKMDLEKEVENLKLKLAGSRQGGGGYKWRQPKTVPVNIQRETIEEPKKAEDNLKENIVDAEIEELQNKIKAKKHTYNILCDPAQTTNAEYVHDSSKLDEIFANANRVLGNDVSSSQETDEASNEENK